MRNATGPFYPRASCAPALVPSLFDDDVNVKASRLPQTIRTNKAPTDTHGNTAPSHRVTTLMPSMVDRVARRLPRPLGPAWRLAVRTITDALDDRVPGLAAEAAFFALLALPPLLLAILGSMGFVATAVEPQALQDIKGAGFRVLGTFLAPPTLDTLRELTNRLLEQGSGRIVSLGLLVALWSGSRAVNAFLETITLAYDLERRSTIKRRLRALVFTVVGMVLAVAVVPAVVVGPRILQLIPRPLGVAAHTALRVGFWPAVVAVALALLASFYHWGAPQQTPWRRDLPGAVLAVMLWILGTVGVRLYLAYSIRGSPSGTAALYGPLATPLVVLVWLYVTALAVLLGAELNAEIEKL